MQVSTSSAEFWNPMGLAGSKYSDSGFVASRTWPSQFALDNKKPKSFERCCLLVISWRFAEGTSVRA